MARILRREPQVIKSSSESLTSRRPGGSVHDASRPFGQDSTMDVTPLRHEGLGNSTYLIDLGHGEAALVDPGRPIDGYLAAAHDHGVRIRAVLETHLHADFVTGSLEIAAATGAEVFVPAGAKARFPHRPVEPDD